MITMKAVVLFPLLLMLISLPFYTYGQRFHLSGSVVEMNTMQPVRQVSVSDKTSGTGTITTEQGIYSLLLSPGPVEILFTGQNFEPITYIFELKGDTVIDVRLNIIIQDNRTRRLRKDTVIALNQQIPAK
jgi:hypothetical protein